MPSPRCGSDKFLDMELQEQNDHYVSIECVINLQLLHMMKNANKRYGLTCFKGQLKKQ